MISDEAVEAAAKAFIEHGTLLEALEAAAPHMISHERQQTADAHRDAIVNRDTADRLERKMETAKADAWDEGRRASDLEWQQSYDLVTPDEHRFVATNPYRSQA